MFWLSTWTTRQVFMPSPSVFSIKLAAVCVYVKHSPVLYIFFNLSWKTVNISPVSVKWNPNPQLGIWGPLQHSLILPTTSSTNALLLFQLSRVIFRLAFSSPLWRGGLCCRPSRLPCFRSTLPVSLTLVDSHCLSFLTKLNHSSLSSLFPPWRAELYLLCLLWQRQPIIAPTRHQFPAMLSCSQHSFRAALCLNTSDCLSFHLDPLSLFAIASKPYLFSMTQRKSNLF